MRAPPPLKHVAVPHTPSESNLLLDAIKKGRQLKPGMTVLAIVIVVVMVVTDAMFTVSQDAFPDLSGLTTKQTDNLTSILSRYEKQ